jgi:hypothetical protein
MRGMDASIETGPPHPDTRVLTSVIDVTGKRNGSGCTEVEQNLVALGMNSTTAKSPEV